MYISIRCTSRPLECSQLLNQNNTASLTIMSPTKSQFQKYLHPTSCRFYGHQYFHLYHIANYISNNNKKKKYFYHLKSWTRFSGPLTSLMCNPGNPLDRAALCAKACQIGPLMTRDQTHTSCTGSWILYYWATREARTTSHWSLKSLKCWRGCWEKESSYTVAGNARWCSHYGNQYRVSSES